MIVRGIELLSKKLLNLLDLCQRFDVNPDTSQLFVNQQHNNWCQSMLGVCMRLTEWETTHHGSKTFGKAFDFIEQNLGKMGYDSKDYLLTGTENSVIKKAQAEALVKS